MNLRRLTRAARVLDLYDRTWEGKPLGAGDDVISADEKTSIQARFRCHPSLPRHHGAHPSARFMAEPGIDIFFSIVQRKVLSPNDFTDLDVGRTARVGCRSFASLFRPPAPSDRRRTTATAQAHSNSPSRQNERGRLPSTTKAGV